MRVREPVARPLDIVAVELLLTAAQAFLVGVLLYLAVGFWEDAGVGLATQAAVLGILGLGLGGSWLYWLLGGVGWPMAAFNTPAAMFLAFLLVMDWSVEAFDIGGAPLGLATAAAIFGVVAGVFLDSPRRWRWDQREKPRPGTRVPRVTATTRAVAAQVPRSLPKRTPAPEEVSELAARIEATTPASGSAATGAAALADAEGEGAAHAPETETGAASELADAPDVPGTPLEVPATPEPVMPTARLGRSASGDAEDGEEQEEDDAIELPTMIEPKAQRSPWAWAAPPDWNRDEDDEHRSSSGS